MKASPSVSRRFFFTEWHSPEVTKVVATAFAKQVHDRMISLDLSGNKQKKIEFLAGLGLKMYGSRFTVADMTEALQKAVQL